MAQQPVVSIEDRLIQWRALANSAEAAERQTALAGSAHDSGSLKELEHAKMLRQLADREFAAIVRAVRMDDDKSTS